MAQSYWRATEPANIAEDYMKYHPDLIGAEIGWVFKEKATKRNGEPLVGKAFKTPKKYKPLMETHPDGTVGFDFIIVIGADAWQDLTNDEKSRWVDTLLQCCYGEEQDDGTMKWKTRKPEISTFPVILSRHGMDESDGSDKLQVIDLDDEDEDSDVDPKVVSSSDSDQESDMQVNNT